MAENNKAPWRWCFRSRSRVAFTTICESKTCSSTVESRTPRFRSVFPPFSRPPLEKGPSLLLTLPQGSTAALVLILGSLVWSLLGAGLQLLATAQLLVPLLDRLIAAPWFGYGRLVPASQFLLSYGWLGSGLLGVLLILAPRFSGIAFRYGRLLVGAALLWQLSIFAGFTQILFEGPSGLIGLSQPRFVSVLLILSFLVLGTGLNERGRR